MKIPLCITLLALSCTLLIFAVGCNDSAVTEIDVDNQDEQSAIPTKPKSSVNQGIFFLFSQTFFLILVPNSLLSLGFV
ncbi:MAG: hypothetical protein F4100_12235 [Rhodothermaceae bacterium]|nr:hypothetical protein [Rhodothermaceae bacterium]